MCAVTGTAATGQPFAGVHAHSGMVAYQGEKMSKSLGNLVFVSRLREQGADPMAIRLALLAHHYRSDWEWTDADLSRATTRLNLWRRAVTRTEGISAETPSRRCAAHFATTWTPRRTGRDRHGRTPARHCQGMTPDAPTRSAPWRKSLGSDWSADPTPTVGSAAVKTFEELYAELTEKARTRPEGSGTVKALDAGVHAIGKKIVEEAAEVWMACEYQDAEAAAEEISQLLYHLQVMMIARDITLDDVYRYL